MRSRYTFYAIQRFTTVKIFLTSTLHACYHLTNHKADDEVEVGLLNYMTESCRLLEWQHGRMRLNWPSEALLARPVVRA